MRFLVTGGAGYVGSHFVAEALRSGHDCIVVDNLSRGHRAAVAEQATFHRLDLLETAKLREIVAETKPQVVLHYASFALVAESVAHPELYFRNNVEGMQSLLSAAAEGSPAPVPVVFSSTCAVYGVPAAVPIDEENPSNPISPYGESKVKCEALLADYVRRTNAPSLALRYFNACGADPEGGIGEDHEPESHLIPNLVKAALQGAPVTIFGNDFPTKDGTCVRDYIHVTDLARSHLAAADYLINLSRAAPATFEAMNLGTGQGYSNLEILRAVEMVCGGPLDWNFGPRRDGDPPELVADARRASERLGFRPQFSDLATIIKTAWLWHKDHPKGFAQIDNGSENS